jgi:hypothetical protein
MLVRDADTPACVSRVDCDMPGHARLTAIAEHTRVTGNRGRHRRPAAAADHVVVQYTKLIVDLRIHRPGARSGMCLDCGTPWPCARISLACSHHHSPSADGGAHDHA